MPKRPITIEEEVQNIRQNELEKDYDFDPKSPRRFYTSNVLQRVLARLFGYSAGQPVALQCTTAGILKVASTGQGFEHNDTKSGNAPDSYGSALAFDSIVSRVDVWIWDKSAIVKRTPDNVVWEDELEIPANTMYSFDCVTHSINIKNKTGGQTARYQIIGWW